jgi:hypothetical protein
MVVASQSQTQTQSKVEYIDAYWGYLYEGKNKVMPPYEWIDRVHDLLNIPLHYWGVPLLVQKKFFEVDEHLGVMSPREWTQYCGVEVLTMPMFYHFDIVVKDVGGDEDDYVRMVWKNNAEKWKAIEAVNKYSILDNPPPGAVIIGTALGGIWLPDRLVRKFKHLYALKVNSKGHDEAPGYAVTDYSCFLIAGVT